MVGTQKTTNTSSKVKVSSAPNRGLKFKKYEFSENFLFLLPILFINIIVIIKL